MSETTFSLRDFPPIDEPAWRKLVDEGLKGAAFDERLVTATYEGIAIQPLYTRRSWDATGDPSGFAGFAPFTRGGKPLGNTQTGWEIRQEHAHPDLKSTNTAIREDIANGVTSITLRLDAAVRRGLDPAGAEGGVYSGRDGVMVNTLADLDAVLADVPLDRIGIALEPGAAFIPAAGMLSALCKRRGVGPQQARGALNADPLGTFASEGVLPYSLKSAYAQLADLAAWNCTHWPKATAVRVNTRPYHNAGATSVQDLAIAMATGIEYLRVLGERGLDVTLATRQMLFSIDVGTHFFRAIAKLRAARKLWARVVEACGGRRYAQTMRIEARTAQRVFTRRDPWGNLLRNTAGCFAAAAGGADVITSAPFDAAIGLPSDQARRIARSTHHILAEESHLHRVHDPAGGAWFVEKLTDQLCEQAWALLQQIERWGGMGEALQSGWIADQIDTAMQARQANIATRRDAITGVSEYPNVAEKPVERETPDREGLRADAITRTKLNPERNASFTQLLSAVANASLPSATARALLPAALEQAAECGATLHELLAEILQNPKAQIIGPLEPLRFAQGFERLRDLSDDWLERTGRRPCVFLASMGPVAQHTARATFARNFFETGGFEAPVNDGFSTADEAGAALRESGAKVAVICSSDKLYVDLVPQLAPILKKNGARTVILAGRPGEHEATWRQAGVDRFIHVGANTLDTLRELLAEEGVMA